MSTKLHGGQDRPSAEILADTAWACNGRHVTPGTELSIKGESGRFAFRRYALSARSEWIDVYGGKAGHEAFRSFDPARVIRVHRTIKRRPS